MTIGGLGLFLEPGGLPRGLFDLGGVTISPCSLLLLLLSLLLLESRGTRMYPLASEGGVLFFILLVEVDEMYPTFVASALPMAESPEPLLGSVAKLPGLWCSEDSESEV